MRFSFWIAVVITFVFSPASARIVIPVRDLESLVKLSTAIVVGTPASQSAPRDSYSATQVKITNVYKGDIPLGSVITVPAVNNFQPIPRDNDEWGYRPPFKQVDSVLLFLVKPNDRNRKAFVHPETEWSEISGGGQCLFSGEQAFACFQEMSPPATRTPRKIPRREMTIDPVMDEELPSNRLTLSKKDILDQLDEALHPSPKRQALLTGDANDPTLIVERCRFLTERFARFHGVMLHDETAGDVSGRLYASTNLAKLDELIMGADPALSNPVPARIYWKSPEGRQHMLQHLADPQLAEPVFDKCIREFESGFFSYRLQEGVDPYEIGKDDFLKRFANVAVSPTVPLARRALMVNAVVGFFGDITPNDFIGSPLLRDNLRPVVGILQTASNDKLNFTPSQQKQLSTCDAYLTGVVSAKEPNWYGPN